MNHLHNYVGTNMAYWTKRAPGYSEVNREELQTAQRQVWSRALDDRIQAHFQGAARASLRVLDVGTGPGFFAIILAELGYRVTAVDYTEAMLEQALLDEVRALLARGVPPEATCLQAIGYKELLAYLAGRCPLSEAVADIQRESRRYAKRQLTWFRRNPAIHWIRQSDAPDGAAVLREALDFASSLGFSRVGADAGRI